MKDLNLLGRFKKYTPYISILVGAIVALLSGLYSQGFWFYTLSSIGLLIALGGQFISDWLEKKIDILNEVAVLNKKSTPPQFKIGLKYKNDKEYLVLIQHENLIPIKFKMGIVNDQNVYLSGLQIDWGEIYPTQDQKNFNYITKINQNPPAIIKLLFHYQSIWSSEMNKKELTGHITQTYSFNNHVLSFISEERI